MVIEQFKENTKWGHISMKIAICDDIRQDLYTTRDFLQEYCEKAMLDAEIDLYENGSQLLPRIAGGAYDLYLLDIYMEPVGGMELARRIRQEDRKCEIIFITTSPDFALDGFGVQAIGYLLKPLTQEALASLLDHHSQRFLHSARYITIRHSRTEIRLPRKTIIYLEIFGKQTILYTSDGSYRTWTSLDELERQLDGEPFLRCHRSYIVNMQYIDHIQGTDFVLEDGTKIPLPSHDAAQYRKIWQDYLFAKAKERLYER